MNRLMLYALCAFALAPRVMWAAEGWAPERGDALLQAADRFCEDKMISGSEREEFAALVQREYKTVLLPSDPYPHYVPNLTPHEQARLQYLKDKAAGKGVELSAAETGQMLDLAHKLLAYGQFLLGNIKDLYYESDKNDRVFKGGWKGGWGEAGELLSYRANELFKKGDFGQFVLLLGKIKDIKDTFHKGSETFKGAHNFFDL